MQVTTKHHHIVAFAIKDGVIGAFWLARHTQQRRVIVIL